MQRQFIAFMFRLVLNSIGFWVAIKLFGTGNDQLINNSPWLFLTAGLVFSVANALLRPLLIILALPAILLTLGLFTIVVNGAMVYISLLLTPGISMTFWHSILTGLVLSLLNYVVSSMVEFKHGT